MKTRGVSEYKKLAERALHDLHLDRETPRGLFEPIEYMLEGGGKRLRPVLLLAASEAVGGDAEKCLPQAAGIEMYHNFTLLHDDVMDRSPLRHGKPTVHSKWDVATAILSGDAMLTKATQLITEGLEGSVAEEVLGTFNDTAMLVYKGQQLDMEFESRLDVKPAEYLSMIGMKTGALIAGACLIGAIAGGADTREVGTALYKYGMKLGIAFQIQDDLLDTYGDEKVFGKPIGGDILNDKKTWLLVNALQSGSSKELKEIITGKSLQGDAKIEAVRAIYDRENIRERSVEMLETSIAGAISSLDSVKEKITPGSYEVLRGYVEGLAGRVK